MSTPAYINFTETSNSERATSQTDVSVTNDSGYTNLRWSFYCIFVAFVGCVSIAIFLKFIVFAT